MSHLKHLGCLMVSFLILWVSLAIAPLHRDDWMLENVLLSGPSFS